MPLRAEGKLNTNRGNVDPRAESSVLQERQSPSRFLCGLNGRHGVHPVLKDPFQPQEDVRRL